MSEAVPEPLAVQCCAQQNDQAVQQIRCCPCAAAAARCHVPGGWMELAAAGPRGEAGSRGGSRVREAPALSPAAARSRPTPLNHRSVSWSLSPGFSRQQEPARGNHSMGCGQGKISSYSVLSCPLPSSSIITSPSFCHLLLLLFAKRSASHFLTLSFTMGSLDSWSSKVGSAGGGRENPSSAEISLRAVELGQPHSSQAVNTPRCMGKEAGSPAAQPRRSQT